MYGVSRFAHQTRFGLARYLIVTSAACFRLPVIGKGAAIESFCDYCEHDRFVLVSFVLKVSVNFRSVDRNIKIALDALKELGGFNSL